MALQIPEHIYTKIAAHLEDTFPKEGGGLLLGDANKRHRNVRMILTVENSFPLDEQHNRYELPINSIMNGEDVAEEHAMDMIGVFHSHPNHPALPSDYDREKAWPWWSYLIVSVHEKGAGTARSWILTDDRTRFNEETVYILDEH